jgi:hypothetical protein
MDQQDQSNQSVHAFRGTPRLSRSARAGPVLHYVGWRSLTAAVPGLSAFVPLLVMQGVWLPASNRRRRGTRRSCSWGCRASAADSRIRELAHYRKRPHLLRGGPVHACASGVQLPGGRRRKLGSRAGRGSLSVDRAEHFGFWADAAGGLKSTAGSRPRELPRTAFGSSQLRWAAPGSPVRERPRRTQKYPARAAPNGGYTPTVADGRM